MTPENARLGRKRDDSRDGDILDAALEVLAEFGYDRMTMDMVATRAKAGKATVYRRWSSKALMVVDAVARMAQGEIDLNALPDTGSLRGDLVGLIRAEALDDGQRRLKVMSAVASMLATQENPELIDSATTASTRPWVVANRIMITRAVERGEVADTVDVDFMAGVIPAMCYFRVSVEGQSLDAVYVRTLIDHLLIPALGAR